MLNFSMNKNRPAGNRLRRRDFLKLGAIATGVLFNPLSALAVADPRSKPFKNLAFYNTHTLERLHICYCRNGKYDIKALAKINHILRDHRSGEVRAIDTRLLDLLHTLSGRLKTESSFHIISGYRSPESNSKLRRNGRGVASKSMHMLGKAIDIRLPGVNTRFLRDAAVKIKGGGVGYYAKSNFVHVDVGRVRFW